MSFHKNLNADDLHAPSILLIENAGETTINVGEVLFVTGYNRTNRRYKVRRAVELPNIVLAERALVYGISNVLIPTVNDRGTMVAFGIVEELEVVETSNTRASTTPVPIRNNAPVFIDIDPYLDSAQTIVNPNVGKIVTGTAGQTVEAGVIIEIVSTGVVTAFVFSLTAGFVDFAETRALKLNIPFNTYDDTVWTEDTTNPEPEIFAIIEHDKGILDFVLQFYEYRDQGSDPDHTDVDIDQGARYGALDVEWKTDATNPLNAIRVSFPLAVPRFVGYIEMIY